MRNGHSWLYLYQGLKLDAVGPGLEFRRLARLSTCVIKLLDFAQAAT